MSSQFANSRSMPHEHQKYDSTTQFNKTTHQSYNCPTNKKNRLLTNTFQSRTCPYRLCFWQDLFKSFYFFIVCLPLFAHAQVLGNSSTLMQKVINELTIIGGLVVTIAIMFCGFRMVFQAAQWKDIAPIFWGGVLIGGAASIAGTVLS